MRFIVLGDLHYANYSRSEVAASRDRFFEAFFRQVAAHQADIVFAIGDTTNRGTLTELKGETEIARRVGLELVRITGNHDTDSLDKSELAPYFLGGRASASSSELYTSFDFGPVRFILADTSRSKCSSIDWSGFVPEEQLGWLEAEIERFNAETQPKYLAVLGHHPMFGTTDRSTEDRLNIANSEAVYQVFYKLTRTPGVYICGHNHSNSLAGPDAQGWYYIQAGAPLVCLSYRLLTVDEKGFRVETVDMDLSDAAVKADFEMTRQNFEEGFSVYPLEAMYGAESDHRLLIPA